MEHAILAGSAGALLGAEIAKHLGWELAPCASRRFPDGEVNVRVGHVEGNDLYVVQATGPPVDENMIELLLIADACRHAGAARLTAVLPYLGYARQDRRTSPGEALGSQVMGDLLAGAGFDRIVVLDPHSEAFQALCRVRVEVLSAWKALAEVLRTELSSDTVVVAPDEGARHLAERYAFELGLDLAVVRKRRSSGEEVSVEDVAGDVTARPLLVVDDMVSTGATVSSAIGALLERGARADVVLCAVHGLFVGQAINRLETLSLRRLFVTDSLPRSWRAPCETTVVSISLLLANCIQEIAHRNGRDAKAR
jgi:ribose-phosphate pyrophosphokinase